MARPRTRWRYSPPDKVTAPPLSEIWRPAGYVLLSEGVEIMGRADFGSDWTGAELKARQSASTTPEPKDTFLLGESGVERIPDTRKNLWMVKTADGRGVFIHSEQEARERWSDERSKMLEHWKAEYAARERFDAVISRIRTELYGGNLHAFALRQRVGDLVSIPVHVWGRSDISAVFELGDSDWKWSHPNVITFSAEIGNYGSHVSVEGTTLVRKQELQALFVEKPEQVSEREAEPDGRKEHTPLKVSPEKPESGERNKAVASPQLVPEVAKKSSQKKRRGGLKPGPYYSKLVRYMTLLHEKDFEKFENGTNAELRELVLKFFKRDDVVGYPSSRSGLDDAITRAKQEVIDSADRI